MPSASFRNVTMALAVGAACGVGGAIAYDRLRPREAAAADVEVPAPAAQTPDEPPADWCAPGFEPIEGGGCLALPTAMPATALIVYLHGRYARDAAGDETDRQRRLGARAGARGLAVLAFRGRLGACSAPELATWYCWPSNETNADAGAGVASAWARALTAAQDRSGAHHRFLLGFSNGGYFAGLIASQGLLDVDAVVIAHGGPVEPVAPLRGMTPLLLLSADDDVAQDEMIRFDEELARVRWPHDSYARGGGHGLADEDIDAALAFFARSGEALPLQPPLSAHRAVRHVRDAGADSGIQADNPPEDDASIASADAGRAAPPDDDSGETPAVTPMLAPQEPVEASGTTTAL